LAGIQDNTYHIGQENSKVQKINKNNSYNNKKEWSEGVGKRKKATFPQICEEKTKKKESKKRKVKNQFGIRKRKE